MITFGDNSSAEMTHFKHPIQTNLLDGNQLGLALITHSFNLLCSHSETMCWNPPVGSFLECSGSWSIWRAAHYISHLSLSSSLTERPGRLSAGSFLSLQTVMCFDMEWKVCVLLLRRDSGDIAAPREQATVCMCHSGSLATVCEQKEREKKKKNTCGMLSLTCFE